MVLSWVMDGSQIHSSKCLVSACRVVLLAVQTIFWNKNVKETDPDGGKLSHGLGRTLFPQIFEC